MKPLTVKITHEEANAISWCIDVQVDNDFAGVLPFAQRDTLALAVKGNRKIRDAVRLSL